MTESAGEYASFRQWMEHDERYRETIGSSFNFDKTPSFLRGAGAAVAANRTNLHIAADPQDKVWAPAVNSGIIPLNTYVTVSIPLSCLLPCFRSKLLLPSFLAAGLRLELTTHKKERFFCGLSSAVWSTAGLIDPVISDVYIYTETFQLADSISKKLSQISASTGLEYAFTAVHQQPVTTNLGELSVSISRALSRANNVMCKIRSNDSYNSVTNDSFTSLPILSDSVRNNATVYGAELKIQDGTLDAFSVQLGAHSIPAAPVSGLQEAYMSTMKTFGAYRRTDASVGPTIAEWAGSVEPLPSAPATYAAKTNVGCYCLPLESSSVLAEAGAAISAQRSAQVLIRFKTAQVVQRRIDIWVEFSKLCSVFLDQVIVRN